MNQIDMFQMFSEQRQEEMIPVLEIGQTMYEPALDTVNVWTVDGMFKGARSYSYNLYNGREPRGYHTLLGHNIGVTCFKTLEEAQQVASQDRTETIIPELTDYVGWSTFRKVDGNKLKYIVAKVGEKQLFWKQGETYTFLDTFKSKIERDRRYREEVERLLKEVHYGLNPKEEIFEIEKLYKVNNQRYASLDYARRHKNE